LHFLEEFFLEEFFREEFFREECFLLDLWCLWELFPLPPPWPQEPPPPYT
jgi:hypothetical protein